MTTHLAELDRIFNIAADAMTRESPYSGIDQVEDESFARGAALAEIIGVLIPILLKENGWNRLDNGLIVHEGCGITLLPFASITECPGCGAPNPIHREKAPR